MLAWRQEFFHKQFSKKELGLEIGPSHAPIAAKKDGYNVKIVDHTNRTGLIKKYGDLHIDTSQIEEVDYVWDGEKPLSKLIGGSHKFDYIIASHVIEHTTDLVLFLQDCEKLLKKNGKLCLAIPDKRYCFDYFRFPSNIADVLEAYRNHNVRHIPGKVFDAMANGVRRGSKEAWSSTDTEPFNMRSDLEFAKELYRKALKSKEYIDLHNWMFTPNSLKLLLADLQTLNMTKLSYADELPTQGFEFFAILSPSAPAIKTPRIRLLNNMMGDIKIMLHVDTLDAELTAARQELAAAKDELTAVKQSKRWRYSEALARCLDKAKRMVRG